MHVMVRIALAFLPLLVGARLGLATSDPSVEPDRSDVANARAAVARGCDCPGAAATATTCAAPQTRPPPRSSTRAAPGSSGAAPPNRPRQARLHRVLPDTTLRQDLPRAQADCHALRRTERRQRVRGGRSQLLRRLRRRRGGGADPPPVPPGAAPRPSAAALAARGAPPARRHT